MDLYFSSSETKQNSQVVFDQATKPFFTTREFKYISVSLRHQWVVIWVEGVAGMLHTHFKI